MSRVSLKSIFSKKNKLNNIPQDCVAICASAIRTERWLDIYNFFKNNNKQEFIMIFSGHVRPEFDLPENFYYIHSQENAAYCSELALRTARSIPEVKYTMSIPDDCSFSKGCLDALVSEMEKNQGKMIEIGMGFWGDYTANEQAALSLKYFNSNPNSPSLTMCGMRSKETCAAIGSIDKNFKGQYWDVDRTMRLLSMGGEIKTIDHLKVIEMNHECAHHLLGPKYYKNDRGFLDLLWTLDEKAQVPCNTKRLKEVDPFLEEDLQAVMYSGNKNMIDKNNKTVIVAPAIKIKFWKNLYKNFCKSKIPFHFVFVGHTKPDFKLPENFTFIHCELGPAEATEIAYRYAYKHISDAKYIMNTADDAIISEYLLDKLVAYYEKKVEELDNDFLIISNMFKTFFDEENLMAFYNGGPILLCQMFTTMENSKKIGGIDKRFKAIYWDCDRHLRAHQMGANVLWAPLDEVPPSKEGEYSKTGGLWNEFGGHDHTLLKEMWKCEPGGDRELFCSEMRTISGRPTNVVVQKKLLLTRLDEVQEYDDTELEAYYE